ncbi:protein of unknown function [Bacillus velezensis UCMB5033]|nr:protein of unknown function [Bacillus velezensis UCMB5033]
MEILNDHQSNVLWYAGYENSYYSY